MSSLDPQYRIVVQSQNIVNVLNDYNHIEMLVISMM